MKSNYRAYERDIPREYRDRIISVDCYIDDLSNGVDYKVGNRTDCEVLGIRTRHFVAITDTYKWTVLHVYDPYYQIHALND